MTANLLIADRAFDADRRVLDPLAAAGTPAAERRKQPFP
jgi:hypothetical protein